MQKCLFYDVVIRAFLRIDLVMLFTSRRLLQQLQFEKGVSLFSPLILACRCVITKAEWKTTRPGTIKFRMVRLLFSCHWKA